MLDINGQEAALSGKMPRRDFLRVGALAATGLTLADWLRLQASGEVKPQAKAKSVIQLWMSGGPTHIDTFDPKPDAGEDYTGPLKKTADTKIPGMRLGELMVKMAQQADKFAILRGLTHSSYAHEIGTYMMLTGTMPSPELVYPSMGAVVALKREEAGYKGVLPPFLTLTHPLGRFSEAGFLGSRYAPFATGGDPNAKDFRVGGLVPPPGMSPERFKERRDLLKSVDQLARSVEDDQFKAVDTYQEKAYSLILGDAKKAFDLSQEKDELRLTYGRTFFGQACLLARRLVEQGVPFITINWGGWDTHKDHFPAMKSLLPVLDQGFAALLEDLAQRGLLDSTIITWFGEFGRTPKVANEPPWDGGRHHFCPAFSAVAAGGGFKGGQVVGVTDDKAEKVRERPIYPWDLTASMYKLLGIDPASRLPHPHGCVAYVTPVGSGSVASGGLLNEIM